MKYSNIVNEANKFLASHNEWVLRYKEYAQKIIKSQERYKTARQKFRVSPPLYVYTCIDKSLKAEVLNYDLRFLGQSVATVKVKKDNSVSIITEKRKTQNNEKYFGIDIRLNDDWRSSKAAHFRKAFKTCMVQRGHSKEHQIESFLLNEFSKKNGISKAVCNIQPVLLANAFFQMPTPFKASKQKISYVGKNGGGVDILSRVRHKDNTVRLCVMELKDEYSNTEPPEKAMQQAVAYATFIAHLLRSESGNNWYSIWGFSGIVPDELFVDVTIVMPLPKDKVPVNFDNQRLEVCGKTYLELSSLYLVDAVDYSNNPKIDFIGSLKETMY